MVLDTGDGLAKGRYVDGKHGKYTWMDGYLLASWHQSTEYLIAGIVGA